MSGRKGIIFCISAAVVSVIAAVTMAYDSHASVIRANNNTGEQSALDLCLGSGPTVRTRGAMWVSQVGSSYYNDLVTVTHDQQYVQVQLRGSAVKCTRTAGQTTGTGAQGMGAHHITPQGPNGYRLDNLSSTTLNRGQWSSNVTIPRTGYRGVWTTQGGSITARLNAQGIASPGQTVTISIDLFRCPASSSPPASECYASAQQIRVRRLPVPVMWDITPTTTITSATSVNRPGQTLTWRHRITNTGPNTTNATITYRAQNQGALGTGIVAPSPWTAAGIPATGTNYRQQNSTHLISQADVGNSLCRRTTASPRSWNSSATAVSGSACRVIPYEYDLVPTITNLSSKTIIDSDSRSVGVTGRVTNNGPTKSRPDVNWRITQVTYGPGVVIPHQAGGVGDAPCTFFTGSTDCNESLAVGVEPAGYGYGVVGAGNPQSYQAYTATGSINNDPPGTKICFAMSVQPYDHATGNWRHSQLYCYIVGKSPKVQVHGGSIQVGRTYSGTINADASVKGSAVTKAAGGTFGSWSEYGIFAPASINLVASGSGLNEAGGHSMSTQSSWSPYTFTKYTTGVNDYGRYRYDTTSLPDITTVFSRASAVQTTNFNISTAVKGRAIRPADGSPRTIEIRADATMPTLATGQWLVINAIGHNVTIANDIQYANGPFVDARDIPQLVIIADNITIAADVTRVDAWLVARSNGSVSGGAIATCDEQAGTSGADGVAQWLSMPNGSGTNYTNSSNSHLSMLHCQRQLQINGPVIAQRLYLRRTAGSDAGSGAGTPAEIINLRPDAYMWAREYMSPNFIFQNISERELPPRY